LLLDGTLFRGAHGVAPELGHLRLVQDGRPCSCGKQGCWERYCSGTALATTALDMLAQYKGRATALARAARDVQGLTGRKVAAAARDGDPIARRAMGELARWLGEGLALVADVYDPELIVIAGGVSESSPLFLDAARDHYQSLVTGAGHRPLARIRTAHLGDDAGIVGAATLAIDSA
jgi:glucokinase